MQPFSWSQLTPTSKVVIVSETLDDSVALQNMVTTYARDPVVVIGDTSSFPFLRGEDVFVVATATSRTYWDADVQLDPDIVFVMADCAKSCVSVFVNILPEKDIEEAFAQPGCDALVIDFFMRAQNASKDCVFTFCKTIQ